MNSSKAFTTALLLLVVVTGANAAPARHHAKPHARPAAPDSALAAEARVSMKSARATALARVRDGVIQSEELEREHGKLIYSFDIKVTSRSGIDEVHVDATSGAVIAVAHEGPRSERKEAADERKAASTGTRH